MSVLDKDLLLDQRRLRRGLRWWRFLALGILFVAFLFYGHGLWRGASLAGIRPYVARIHIDGMIANETRYAETIRNLAQDEMLRAVIVDIDSPGGTTTGSEELFLALRHIASTGRPVISVMNGVAASGGYIVALAGDKILARQNTITGSIGVLFQSPDISKLIDKVGLDFNIIQSKPAKGEPLPFKPMSPQARNNMEELVEQGYQWFRELVKLRRNLDEDSLEVVASGEIFLGKRAHDLQLVDELGGYYEAWEWLKNTHNIDSETQVIEFYKNNEKADWFLGQIWDREKIAITNDLYSWVSEFLTRRLLFL